MLPDGTGGLLSWPKAGLTKLGLMKQARPVRIAAVNGATCLGALMNLKQWPLIWSGTTERHAEGMFSGLAFVPGQSGRGTTPITAFSLSLRGRDHQSRSAEIFPAGFR